MQTPSWRLSLLGPGQLTAPEGRLVRCEGKPLALLAYLALEGGATRARLADLLWPEVPEGTARNNLVILLRRLRAATGEELWRADDSLALRPEVAVDARALLAGEPAPDEAALFASGPLLEGRDWPELADFSDWLLAWRERLDEQRARRALEVARAHEAASRWAPALEAARAAVRWNPVSEDAHRALIRLLYLGGDPPAALRAFEACRRVLHEQLRTEPMPVTLELARLIERGGPLPDTRVAPAPIPPSPALHPPGLVGRAAEWAQMEAAWARGQAIILVGEPGSGKSRLAADFVASKGRALLFEGRPGDPTVPFATAIRNLRRVLAQGGPPLEPGLRRSLSRLLPELGDEPDRGDGADTRLRQSIMTVLGRGLSGVTAVISDDMQYSDDASIEVSTLLSAAAFPLGRPGGLPHIVVCYRRGELAERHEQALARLLAAGGAAQIELGPLDEAGVTALLQDLAVPGAAELGGAVARLTGGNPTFVVEAAKHLLAQGGTLDTLPPRLEQLVLQRLARLSVGALSVARAASVLQRDFTVEQVAELLDMPLLTAAQVWDELEAADLMRGERFSHDLVAEAVFGGMPGVVRRLLHRAAARLLGRRDAAPARVARQWLDGGDERAAAPWLLQAGAAARLAFRRREAAAFYAQAADIFARHGEPARAFDATVEHLDLLADLEDPSHQAAAEALLAGAQDAAQRARASVQLSRALADTGDARALEVVARAGLVHAQAAGDLDSEAALQEGLALVALFDCQLDAALAPLQRMRQIGALTGSLDWQARAEENLGLWASYHHLREAVTHLERAERLNLQRGARVRAASSADKLARVQVDLGEPRLALGIHERATGHLLGLEGSEGEKLVNVAGRLMCLQALGELAQALDLNDQVLAAYAGAGHASLWALHLRRAHTLALLGRFEGPLAQLEETRHAATFLGHHVALRAVEQAEVLTQLGRPAEAEMCLQEAEARLETLDDVHLRVRLLLARAALRPAEEAQTLLMEALALAERHGLAGALMAAQARQARLRLDQGEVPAPLEAPRAHGGVITAEEWHHTRFRVLQAAGSPLADAALRDAWSGLQAAVRRVPEGDRETFLTRIPVHVAIQEAARAARLAPV